MIHKGRISKDEGQRLLSLWIRDTYNESTYHRIWYSKSEFKEKMKANKQLFELLWSKKHTRKDIVDLLNREFGYVDYSPFRVACNTYVSDCTKRIMLIGVTLQRTLNTKIKGSRHLVDVCVRFE